MKTKWTRAQHETAVRILERMDAEFRRPLTELMHRFLCNLLAIEVKREFGDPAHALSIRDSTGYERRLSRGWFDVLVAELAHAAGVKAFERGQVHTEFDDEDGDLDLEHGLNSRRHRCVQKVLQFHRDALKPNCRRCKSAREFCRCVSGATMDKVLR